MQATAQQLGIKGRLNIVSLTNTPNDSSRVSGHAALLLHSGVNHHWYIQPALLSSGQGTLILFHESIDRSGDFPLVKHIAALLGNFFQDTGQLGG